jgi:hypothetical protein
LFAARHGLSLTDSRAGADPLSGEVADAVTVGVHDSLPFLDRENGAPPGEDTGQADQKHRSRA